jgi:sulfide:quinone oxidoreductase
MQILQLSLAFSVAGQISEVDVAALAAAGFKAVVGNRPDSEGGTPMALIRAECERYGMKFWSLPVEYATLRLADADRFGAILAQSEPPLVAYCRTGRRCAALWALAMAPYAPVHALIERAASVGIALDDLRELLERSAARPRPGGAGHEPAPPPPFAQRWFDRH